MSVFLLKVVAVISMLFDHLRYLTPEFNNTFTKIMGRIAFPIFAFLISEGCVHTKNYKKYIKRLSIFSLISQIPFSIFIIGCNLKVIEPINSQPLWLQGFYYIYQSGLNVVFTLLLGALAIGAYSKIENKFLKIVLPVLLCAIAELLNTDYGAIGVLTIFAFYVLRKFNMLKLIITFILQILVLFISVKFNFAQYCNYLIPFIIGEMLATILIGIYNGKLGKYKMKYFFYIFYPAHLILISVVYFIINK